MKKILKKLSENKIYVFAFIFLWDALYMMSSEGIQLSDWRYWGILCCMIAIFICGKYSTKK